MNTGAWFIDLENILYSWKESLEKIGERYTPENFEVFLNDVFTFVRTHFQITTPEDCRFGLAKGDFRRSLPSKVLTNTGVDLITTEINGRDSADELLVKCLQALHEDGGECITDDVDSLILFSGDGYYVDELKQLHRDHGYNIIVIGMAHYTNRGYTADWCTIVEIERHKDRRTEFHIRQCTASI